MRGVITGVSRPGFIQRSFGGRIIVTTQHFLPCQTLLNRPTTLSDKNVIYEKENEEIKTVQ